MASFYIRYTLAFVYCLYGHKFGRYPEHDLAALSVGADINLCFIGDDGNPPDEALRKVSSFSAAL